MKRCLVWIAGVLFGFGTLYAQEENSAAPAPDYRKLALAHIESLRGGGTFDCRCEVIKPAPPAPAEPADPAVGQGGGIARRVRFGSTAVRADEHWKKLQILKTDTNETLLSTRRLAPGVAIYDNGETRLVQTLFGEDRIEYRSVGGDLLSLLQPAVLGTAVASAKIEGEVSESNGKTRIVARIDKPSFIHPMKKASSGNNLVWRGNGPNSKILWLEVELTLGATQELESLRFRIQHNDTRRALMAGAAGIFVLEAAAPARGRLVIEELKAVEEQKAAEKLVEVEIGAEVEPVKEPKDAKKEKTEELLGDQDVYSLTPSKGPSKRQSEYLKMMRRAAEQ